jgi:diacylglycerol kinase family enzyme
MVAVFSAESESETGPSRPAPAQPEFFIVLNQGSGAEPKDEVRQAVVQELEQAGRRHRFVPVSPGGIVQACREAARLAKEEGGIMVAVGGDGTLNCAAQAALAADCPLGIIAQGTFNLFARQLGLALDAAEATRMLLHAQPEPVQVGWVNQRTFLVNASVGLYPKLLTDREEVKQKLGRRRWIAMLAAFKSMLEWRRRMLLDVDLDGQIRQVRAASVFVCNNRLQLERVGIAEEVVAQVGEGRLGGVLMHSSKLGAKLRMLLGALVGRLEQEPEIESFTLRSLTLGSRRLRRIAVATDGEVMQMQLPVRFSVAPRPLQVMLPPPAERLPAR